MDVMMSRHPGAAKSRSWSLWCVMARAGGCGRCGRLGFTLVARGCVRCPFSCLQPRGVFNCSAPCRDQGLFVLLGRRSSTAGAVGQPQASDAWMRCRGKFAQKWGQTVGRPADLGSIHPNALVLLCHLLQFCVRFQCALATAERARAAGVRAIFGTFRFPGSWQLVCSWLGASTHYC